VFGVGLGFGKYFGGRGVQYILHVVEYQFQGLPHVHMVFRLQDGVDYDDADQDKLINFVNKYFIAEMPRFAGEECQNVFQEIGKEPFDDAYRRKAVQLVRAHNIHKCNVALNACKKKSTDKCSRGYNCTEATTVTYVDANKSHIVYRRRKVHAELLLPTEHKETSNIEEDDSDIEHDIILPSDLSVVPYNLQMLMDWDSHLNVEYSGSAFSALYVYKYCYKGPEKKEKIELTPEHERDAEDEIKLFMFGRVVCAMSSMWRLYGYRDYPASEPAVIAFKVRTGAQLDDFHQRGQLTDLMLLLIIDFETSCNSVLTELMSYVSKSHQTRQEFKSVFDGFLDFA
jgi:hypothetical protein